MKPRDDSDGPFPESVFPPSIFPRRIFPWMDGDDEEDEDASRTMGKPERKTSDDDDEYASKC